VPLTEVVPVLDIVTEPVRVCDGVTVPDTEVVDVRVGVPDPVLLRVPEVLGVVVTNGVGVPDAVLESVFVFVSNGVTSLVPDTDAVFVAVIVGVLLFVLNAVTLAV
jgi:hypothetical protein